MNPFPLVARSINGALDRAAELGGEWLRARRPVYPVAGVVGLVAGTAVAVVLAREGAIPAWPLPLFAVTAVAVTLGAALAAKVVTGEESLTLYRTQLCVFAAIGLLLRWWGLDAWSYLDLCAIAAAIALAGGRIGCLLVGCCHGRPAAVGIRYTAAHADDGFDARLVGVRLLPVQALESVLLLSLAAWCSAVELRGGPPGAAALQYASLYAIGRFALEVLRGDAERRFVSGVSEAQWTSAAVAVGVVALGWSAGAPAAGWRSVAAATLLLVTAAGLALSHSLLRSSSSAGIGLDVDRSR